MKKRKLLILAVDKFSCQKNIGLLNPVWFMVPNGWCDWLMSKITISSTVV